MPHNNRVSASGALKTNDMWSKTIGYDPYAALADNAIKLNTTSTEQTASLLLLVKLSKFSGSESRGNCKKCGMLGHLTFQCRNTKPSVTAEIDSISSSSDDGTDDLTMGTKRIYESIIVSESSKRHKKVSDRSLKKQKVEKKKKKRKRE